VLQRFLVLSDPEFENNLFTSTPSDSPSTILTNPISTSTLPQSTPPVDTPTNTSQSPSTMDTNLHPNPTYKYPNPVPKCHTNLSQNHLHPNIVSRHGPTQQHPNHFPTNPPPPTHQITTITPQPPIMSTNTNNTTTMFNKLVELNHHKNDHQQQLTILNKHITSHTAHAGLKISMASGTACPTSDILHQHHSEESSKTDGQISSLSTNLNDNLPQELSSTIIHIASTHKPPSKCKTTPKSNTKAPQNHSNHSQPTNHIPQNLKTSRFLKIGPSPTTQGTITCHLQTTITSTTSTQQHYTSQQPEYQL
ncbi:Hypothetical predicted protein, partial [Paramuricea clavata]